MHSDDCLGAWGAQAFFEKRHLPLSPHQCHMRQWGDQRIREGAPHIGDTSRPQIKLLGSFLEEPTQLLSEVGRWGRLARLPTTDRDLPRTQPPPYLLLGPAHCFANDSKLEPRREALLLEKRMLF